MSNTETRYFHDAQDGKVIELTGYPVAVNKPEFQAKFPGVRGVKYDGFSYIVMAVKGSGSGRIADMLPATRRIHYKNRPSLHECNARCMGGKCGGTCECRCGGVNHGRGCSH